MKRLHISEKQRTVILLCILALCVGFVLWTDRQYQTNFVDSF
jgi:hypothetical protein